MREVIVLVGGGGHCRSSIDVIEAQGVFDIVGIIDMPELAGTNVLGYPVIGCDDDLEQIASQYRNFLITLGQIKSPLRRTELFLKIKNLNGVFPVIVSPKAYVSGHAIINEGSIIMHRAFVNANAQIGKNCIINTGAIIEHDAHIEDNCHISTGAIVNGGVAIKEASFVGSGAVIRDNIKIRKNSFIKAASLVKESNE
ncbi:MAG: acetyltransferase [Vulcanimicrobiota bacterium]